MPYEEELDNNGAPEGGVVVRLNSGDENSPSSRRRCLPDCHVYMKASKDSIGTFEFQNDFVDEYEFVLFSYEEEHHHANKLVIFDRHTVLELVEANRNIYNELYNGKNAEFHREHLREHILKDGELREKMSYTIEDGDVVLWDMVLHVEETSNP